MDLIYNCFCSNENCENRSSKIKASEGFPELTCPFCGAPVKILGHESNIYGAYTSASKEQKTEMLKKRSHEHFEKHIKPYKEYKINEAVQSFNDYKKG